MRKKKRIVYATLVLLVVFFSLAAYLIFPFSQPQELPHQEEVKEILASLRYSALEDMAREDFGISLFFEHGAWVLENIFAYDAGGLLVNHQTKTGTCVHLCQITHELIRPLFEKDYQILFVKGNDDSFFDAEAGAGPTHYLLKLRPKDSGKKALVLDPSYGLYDYKKNFADYYFAKTMEAIDLLAEDATNLALEVDTAYPLLLLNRGSQMLALSVRRVDGKYDSDNFALAVTLTKRHGEVGYPLFVFVMRGGEFLALRDEELIEARLNKKKYQEVSGLVFDLWQRIVF